MTKPQETRRALAAPDWTKMTKENKPISYNTIKKNKKLGDFIPEESKEPEEAP